MKKSLGAFLAFAVSGYAMAAGESGIYVEFFSGGQWVAVPGFPNRFALPLAQPGLSSGSSVSLSNVNGVPYRIFAWTPTTHNIGTVSVSGSGGVQPTIFIGFTSSLAANPNSPLSGAAGCTNLTGINFSGNVRPTVQAKILGNLGSGGIQAFQFARIDALDIFGPITHNPSADASNPTFGRVVARNIAGSITSFGGSITQVTASDSISSNIRTLNSGNITEVRAVNSFTGLVDAVGSVGTVEVTNGPIIASSPSVDRVLARNGIDFISATSLQGRIVANNTGTTGLLKRLVTTSGSMSASVEAYGLQSNVASPGISVAGNLVGSLSFGAGGIREPIVVSGSVPLSGSIISTGPMVAVGTDDGRIRVGGSFAGTLDIDGTFNSQAIINSLGLASQTWTGTSTVNAAALSPQPYYDNAPSALGGGAIGLVPFMVHYEACNPVAAGDPLTALGPCTAHAVVPSSISKVSITHYGPVGLWNGSQILDVDAPVINNDPVDGFTVEVATEGSCTWTDVTDSFVTKRIGGNDRTFDIEGPFSNAGPCFTSKFYRIKPVRTLSTGQLYPLVCRGVDTNPVLAGNYEYIIEVEPPFCAPPPEDP